MINSIWYSPVKRRILLASLFFLYSIIAIITIIAFKSDFLGYILSVGMITALILLGILMPGKNQIFLFKHARHFHEKRKYSSALDLLDKLLVYNLASGNTIEIALTRSWMASCLRSMERENKDPLCLERAILLNIDALQTFQKEHPQDYINILGLLSDDYFKLSGYKDKITNIHKSIEYLAKIAEYLNSSGKFNETDILLASMPNNINIGARYMSLIDNNPSENYVFKANESLDQALHHASLLLEKLDPNEQYILKAYTLKNTAEAHFKKYEITGDPEFTTIALEEIKNAFSSLGSSKEVIRHYKNIFTEITKLENTIKTALGNTSEESAKFNCISCGDKIFNKDYYPVCNKCNSKMFEPSVPVPIKIVLVSILAVLTFSLLQFPSMIGAGISYEKAQKAEKEHRYVTAAKEYEKAHNVLPESLLIQSRLFISYVNAEYSEDAQKAYNMLVDKDYNNQALYNEVSEAITRAKSTFFADEQLSALLTGLSNKSSGQRIAELNMYISSFPKNSIALMYLGNEYYDLKKYDDALIYYNRAAEANPYQYDARLDMAAVYRQKNEFEKAQSICDDVLKDSHERYSVYAAKAKIELKRKDYKKALEYATISSKNGYNGPYLQEVLTLSYHYNNMVRERDEAFARLEGYSKDYAAFIKEVLDGKKVYLE